MEDLEMEITEPAPDDRQPADPAPEDAVPEYDNSNAGDPAPADGTEDTGTEEFPVTNPENPEEETGSDETGSGEKNGAEDQTGESGTEDLSEGDGTEDLPGEAADQTGDTVSGNDVITISGNTVIFPEDFDLSQFSSSESSIAYLAAVVDILGIQGNDIKAGFACVSFLLGFLAGAVIVSCFRLRRV